MRPFQEKRYTYLQKVHVRFIFLRDVGCIYYKNLCTFKKQKESCQVLESSISYFIRLAPVVTDIVCDVMGLDVLSSQWLQMGWWEDEGKTSTVSATNEW